MSEQIQNSKNNFPLWKALLKRWFVILIATAVFAAGAVVYSVLKVKTVYTASTSIMLKMAINDNKNASTNTNNATLAKINLPTVKQSIESTATAKAASARYNELNGTEGYNVGKGAISVSHGEMSMIFSLSYSDLSIEQATKKLKAVIDVAPSILAEDIKAESMDLVLVQNAFDEYSSNNSFSVIIIGIVLGLIVGVGLSLLIYLLDNKIRDKDELEELTGSSVIAYIENE